MKSPRNWFIYRDGDLIDALSANTTLYDDTSPDFNQHSYYVEAFDQSQTANSSVKQSEGCLY